MSKYFNSSCRVSEVKLQKFTMEKSHCSRWMSTMTLLILLLQSFIGTQAGLTHNQTVKMTRILIKQCMSMEKILKNIQTKLLKNCPFKLDEYLDCLENTPNNEVYLHPCPSLFYHETDFIPLRCVNGTWDLKDYKVYCRPLSEHEKDINKYKLLYHHNVITKRAMEHEIDIIYANINIHEVAIVCRIIDSVICFTSLVILFILIPLKNNRIMLHRNMIFCVFLLDIFDLIHLTYLKEHDDKKKECSIVFVMKMYLFLAQISWMFNEGFFQFRQFFFVFITKAYMWAYFLIGWIFPAIITFAIYLPVMIENPPFRDHSRCWSMNSNYEINYIIYITVLLLLAVNMCILTYLMWIIWSKLAAGSVNEVNKAKKAARGFSILIVLLGGGYVYLIYGPNDCVPFKYLRAIVIPLQGMLVCIVQVFISREVWTSARTKWKRVEQRFNFRTGLGSPRKSEYTSTTFMKRMSGSWFTKRESTTGESPRRSVDVDSRQADMRLKDRTPVVELEDNERNNNCVPGISIDNVVFEAEEEIGNEVANSGAPIIDGCAESNLNIGINNPVFEADERSAEELSRSEVDNEDDDALHKTQCTAGDGV